MIQLVHSGFFIEHSAFERVRQKLLSDSRGGHLHEVLGRWVRPNDRSLPMAFLGRTLDELVRTPFHKLQQTRGVGPKKIACLIELLERAAGVELEAGEGAAAGSESRGGESRYVEIDVRTSDVSPTGAIWDQWRGAVVAHGLTSLTLGRLAVSLRDLPRPMWHTPLGSYVDLTLDDVGRLHTHGQRRLSAIFQIFRSLYELLGDDGSTGHLCVTVEPKFVRQLDGWTSHWLNGRLSPGPEEVNRGLIAPMVDQLRIDAGDSLAELAFASIGASGLGPRLLEAGPGRPRFSTNWYYLDKIQAIIAARWTEGADRLHELAGRTRARHEQPQGHELMRAAIDVFFGPARSQVLAVRNG